MKGRVDVMSNQLPVYIQIHDQIKSEIEQGVWKIGDRLPSERELAIKFNVSRMTLRQAIQNLADEGILERKIGSGTYVAREKVQEKMSGATSFTEIMESQNRVPSSRTISYFLTSPSSSEMEKLQLKKMILSYEWNVFVLLMISLFALRLRVFRKKSSTDTAKQKLRSHCTEHSKKKEETRSVRRNKQFQQS